MRIGDTMKIINIDQKITSESGSEYKVLSLLGEGGQGKVYKTKNLNDKKEYAFKLYVHPLCPSRGNCDFSQFISQGFLENLKANILREDINKNSFLWPKELVGPIVHNNNHYYGYIMDLFPQNYVGFEQIMKPKSKGGVFFVDFETYVKAMINLCKAFDELHQYGYSYQDLNAGGIRFDVKNGNILICDNDNVSTKNLGIQGMLKYMAPEVGIGMFAPDSHSDRFSLAIILFLLICKWHPLEGKNRVGKALTPKIEDKMYNTEALFVFHPHDESNRPEVEHPYLFWHSLPNGIRQHFVKTFTSGIPRPGMERKVLEIDRQQRVDETIWIRELQKWIDNVVVCPQCSVSNYIKTSKTSCRPQDTKCIHCSKDLPTSEMNTIMLMQNGLPAYPLATIYGNKKIIERALHPLLLSSNDENIIFEMVKEKTGYMLVNKYDGFQCNQGSKRFVFEKNDKIKMDIGLEIIIDKIHSLKIY